MGKLIDEVQNQINTYVEFLGSTQRIRDAVRDLGIGDLECYCHVDIYRYDFETSQVKVPLLTITPSHTQGVGIFMGGGNPSLVVTDTTPILSQIARALLPKVGKFDKSHDAETNHVVLTCLYGGVEIRIEDETPSTCRVEKVEEEVEVPEKVIPAHKEKKVRFVLVGDCDPILADAAAHIETSQGAVRIPPSEQLESTADNSIF